MTLVSSVRDLVMATALVGSPTDERRAEQERQLSHHEDGIQREVAPAESLSATKEMCAYCFGMFVKLVF